MRDLHAPLDSDYLKRVLEAEANDYSQDDEPENWKTELIFKIAVKMLKRFYGDISYDTLIENVVDELEDLDYANLVDQAKTELSLIWKTI